MTTTNFRHMLISAIGALLLSTTCVIAAVGPEAAVAATSAIVAVR